MLKKNIKISNQKESLKLVEQYNTAIVSKISQSIKDILRTFKEMIIIKKIIDLKINILGKWNFNLFEFIIFILNLK